MAAARAGALVIHPGALGDVLLAVPALRALGRSDAITLVAQPRLARLLTTLDVVQHAEPFDTFGLDALFTSEPLASDSALARRLAASARVVCWFGARDPRFVSRLRALAPAAVVAPPANPPRVVWQHLASSVGCADPEVDPAVVPPDVVRHAEARLRDAGWDGTPYVVMHPGAGSVTKRWPAAGFAELIDDCEATVIVHQGPADAEAVDELTTLARRSFVRVVDPPLDALAAILASAVAYVGNDSGVSHLAATVGTRSLVLFTEPLLPWVPWSPTATVARIAAGRLLAAEVEAVRRALRAML